MGQGFLLPISTNVIFVFGSSPMGFYISYSIGFNANPFVFVSNTLAICAKRIILLLFNIIVITIQLILDVKFVSCEVWSEMNWKSNKQQ